MDLQLYFGQLTKTIQKLLLGYNDSLCGLALTPDHLLVASSIQPLKKLLARLV